MWRFVLVVGALGCDGPTTPEPVLLPIVVTPIAVAVAPAAPVSVRAPVRTAVPTSTLAELAVPGSGESFVVSRDSVGSVRLWPTLDGTRAPVIVKTQHADAVATVADGEAIAIATLDSLGQLELVRTERDGAALDRVAIERDRPITSLVATARGFIALQDDQELVAFDARGAVISTLRPAAGDRIVGLVARGEHVLAMFDSPPRAKRSGQLLALGATLTWGARTAAFTAMHDQLPLLSPAGTHVLVRKMSTTSTANIEVVELATGKAVTPPGPGFEMVEPHAFLDDETVVFGDGGELYRWTRGHATTKLALQFGPAAVIGSTLVMGSEKTLALTTGTKTRYLGYRIGGIGDLVSGEHGWLATDAHSIVRLDRELQLTDRVHMVSDRYDTVTLIDGDHAVTEHLTEMTVHDFAHQSSKVSPIAGYLAGFQRATGLGLIYEATKPSLVRWDASHAGFTSLPVEVGTVTDVQLYDPAAVHGIVAAYAKFSEPYQLELTTVGSIGRHGELQHVRTRSWAIDPDAESPAFDTHMPVAHPVAASRDGTLIVEIDRGRMVMHDRDGNVRWERVAPATSLAWNADDELVVFEGGAAFVDTETGALQHPVCGWDFGLWDTMPATAQLTSIPSLCESE